MKRGLFVMTPLIAFCKPCSVPLYCKRLSSRTPAVIIYLRKAERLPPPFQVHFPGRKLPYHNLGFSLAGFTSFHPCNFLQGSSLWHFYRYFDRIRKPDLGHFPAVRPVNNRSALAYGFARREHYGHLSTVRAWTFLYNCLNNCSDYPNAISGDLFH